MEQTEKKTLGSRITETIENSRVVIISILGGAIVIALVIGLVVFFKNSSIEKGLTELDQIEYKYISLDTESETLEDDKTAILMEVTNFADNSSGVVSLRSYIFAGNIAFELEKWAEARDLYVNAYDANDKAYTAPIALFNAGICSDELNELDVAIDYLEKAVEFDNFPLMARALFNLGRIYESNNSIDNALEIYEQVSIDYSESSWAKLAKSRKISLSSK